MDDLIHYDRVRTKDRYRIRRQRELQHFRRMDENGKFDRSGVELSWSEDYEYLLSHGYQLRPRFHPDWTPSWRGTDLSPVACEDSVQHFIASVIDAKRLADGKIVAVKRIPAFKFEAEITRFLSAPERLQDPMNHCVPVYDYFPDDRDSEGGSFIVVPLLRDFDDPPFSYVDEVVDFVRQTLEGLVYIHSLSVAHRDLSDGNIMMDGRPLYGKDGFHPSDQELAASDIMYDAKPRTRRAVGFVKYYFTDFGLSTHFKDPSEPRLVVGNRAQDKDIPELSSFIPYDPFAVDVFTLGMVYKRNFLDKFTNVGFLELLSSSMTERLPEKRPSATRALAIFQQSLSNCSDSNLRWRLRERDELLLLALFGEFKSAFQELVRQMKPPISFILSTFRVIFLSPVKAVRFLLYHGPSRVIDYLRRSLQRRKSVENQPLLS